MKRMTRLLTALLPALALVLAPAPAHAAGTYRNDDGTRETAIRVDISDGADDVSAPSLYIPPRHRYGATGAKVWVYAQATDCDIEGAGHRLVVQHYHVVDFDPCAVFPTTSYAWHAFPVPIEWLWDAANHTVTIEDLDARPLTAREYHPALRPRTGHNAFYGVDSTTPTPHSLYENDGTTDWPRLVSGVLMVYIELTGTVPYIFLYPGTLGYATRDAGTTSPAQTVTVKNAGLAPYAQTVTFTGPAAGDYAVAGSTCGTVQPGATCTFGITFTPQAPGTRHATAVVSGTNGAEPRSITLRGEGRAGPPVSAFTTADGAVLLPADRVRGTVTGVSDIRHEYVTYTPEAPGVPVVTTRAETACAAGTSCTWSAEPLVPPGRYTLTAYGVDWQGNVESPGPSIRVTVV